MYDPSLPYRFGMAADSNPRDLGRMDEVSYRPRAMVTGPMGRVWVASVPDYGLWGGPLSWFDPVTEAIWVLPRYCWGGELLVAGMAVSRGFACGGDDD